jgi:hypothetical protein
MQVWPICYVTNIAKASLIQLAYFEQHANKVAPGIARSASSTNAHAVQQMGVQCSCLMPPPLEASRWLLNGVVTLV